MQCDSSLARTFLPFLNRLFFASEIQQNEIQPCNSNFNGKFV